MSVVIREADLIRSVADALQFISFYHPADYIRPLAKAFELEQGAAAKNAIGQILVNSRMAAMGRRPICQDTGTVNVFLKIGMEVRLSCSRSLQEVIDDAVERAYHNPENPLRSSMVFDALFDRRNTGTNAPAVVHTEIVPGCEMTVIVAAKGGGSENKARFAALDPYDSVVDWVVDTVSSLGAGWCPPGMLGVGVGGSPEKAMLMAKQSLLEPIDMSEVLARGPQSADEELRVEIFERVNKLGIGAQGFGGITTVVDVKLRTFGSHAASKPVGLIPQCAANRHVEFVLDGSGPATLEPPPLSMWPDVLLETALGNSKRVNLDTLTRGEVASWKSGETLLLSGTMLTARDAAHLKLSRLLDEGCPLPVNLRDRAIYYTGPVDRVRDEIIGPAGPTTATRMDRFTDLLLRETGLLVMIGKAERGPDAVEAIRRHGAAYLTAVGGAAYLISKAITAARVVAFEDLGMEAIYEIVVRDMPTTVAVDSTGASIHVLGPAKFRKDF